VEEQFANRTYAMEKEGAESCRGDGICGCMA
jgi:hypothetical protein